MKYIKRFFGVSALLAIGFAVWWMGMNYNGYCHAEGRYLSDEERINSAVQYVLDRYPPTISKQIEVNDNGVVQKRDYWYAPEKPVMYKDINDFMLINPECCRIGMSAGESGPANVLDRLTGYVSSYVIVRYKVRYLEEKNEKYAMDGTAVAIKNCGRAWSGL